jgi:hypothetical protein
MRLNMFAGGEMSMRRAAARVVLAGDPQFVRIQFKKEMQNLKNV